MRRPPLRRPRGSGEVVAPGHPGSIGSVPSGRAAAGPAGGARIPGGGTRALGAAWRAATPPPHPHPHLPTASDTSGLSGWVDSLRPPQNGHRIRITASRARPASLVPLERAGTAPWTAVPGDQLSDTIDNTFLSTFYTCPLHVRRIW